MNKDSTTHLSEGAEGIKASAQLRTSDGSWLVGAIAASLAYKTAEIGVRVLQKKAAMTAEEFTASIAASLSK